MMEHPPTRRSRGARRRAKYGNLRGAGRRAIHTVLLCLLVALATPAAAGDIEEGIEYSVPARLATRSLLLDVARVDGLLVAVGDRGHILVSRDGGDSWSQARVPTRSMLTGVFFADPDHGWAVGHDGVILRTTDGARTWEMVRWAPEEENPLFDVRFSDTLNGFAVGAYGTFLATSDGGDTWTPRTIGESDFHLHRIVPGEDTTLFIPAEAGTIYRSDDGGLTWAELPSPYEGSFFGATSLGDGAILVFGLRGHLYRSEDRGQTWEPLETSTTALLTDGLVLDDGTVLITGLGGVVLASRDGGRTFELHQQADRKGIQAVIQGGDGKLVLVGEFGVKTVSPAELLNGSR